MCGEGKVCSCCATLELPRHLNPRLSWAAGFLTSPPQIIVLFHLVSALKREAPAGRSAIIQLNSAREFTALWQQVHLRSPPPLRSHPSSGINRRANMDAYATTHTPVHKIHTPVSKQARAVAPALCFCLCFTFTNPPLHPRRRWKERKEEKKKKKRQHNHPATQIRT